MATSRDSLQDENKLLLDLEQLASGRSGGEDWVQFFSSWRGINEGLIAKSDSDLNQALDEEIERLEKLCSAIADDNSSGGQFWKNMFNLDIEAAKGLKA